MFGAGWLQSVSSYQKLRSRSDQIVSGISNVTIINGVLFSTLLIILILLLSFFDSNSARDPWYFLTIFYILSYLAHKSVMFSARPIVLVLGASGDDATKLVLCIKQLLGTTQVVSLLSFDGAGVKGFDAHGGWGSLRVRDDTWKDVFHAVANDVKIIVFDAGQSTDHLSYELEVVKNAKSLHKKTVMVQRDPGVLWASLNRREFNRTVGSFDAAVVPLRQIFGPDIHYNKDDE